MSIHSIALQDVRLSNFKPDSLEAITAELKARERRKKIAAAKLKARQEPVIEAVLEPIEEPAPTVSQIRSVGKRFIAEVYKKRADEKRAEYEQRQKEELQKKLDEILEKRLSGYRNFITMKQISLEVAKKYANLGITYAQLFSAQRHREIVAARQECFYRCSVETNKSLPEIGRYFGNKDHTTVLHGIRKYKELQKYPKVKPWLPVEYIIPAEAL